MEAGFWVSILMAAIVLPIAGWVLYEVHKLRVDLTAFQAGALARMEERQTAWANAMVEIRGNCTRHQEWSEDLQRNVSRVDRNIALLCQKADIDYEKPQ